MDHFSSWNLATTCEFFQISLTYRGKMKHFQVALSKFPLQYFLGGGGGFFSIRFLLLLVYWEPGRRPVGLFAVY